MSPDSQAATSGHVFISYARDDGAKFARRLAEDLERSGVSVWMDRAEIAPGDQFHQRIQDALRGARAVLVVLTPAAARSSYVSGEWHTALNWYTPVLPLAADVCEMPVGLASFQFLDFRTQYTPPFQELIARLDALDDAQLPILKAALAELRKMKRAAADRRRFDPKVAALKARIAGIDERIRQRPPVPAPDSGDPPVVRTRARDRHCRWAGMAPPDTLQTFFDRTIQQREIVDLVESDSCRMVSVIGRGGIGKTALLFAVFERLAGDDGAPLDGIAFVDARSSRVPLELVFEHCAALLDEKSAG